MNHNTRPPLVLRNVDAQAPSRVLSRPSSFAAKVPTGATSAVGKPQPTKPLPAAEAHATAPARGHQEGYEAGVREGLKDAQRQITELLEAQVAKLEAQAHAQLDKQTQEHAQRIERMDQLLDSLESAVTARLSELEPQAVALAFEALCKLLGQPSTHADTLAGFVQHGVHQIRHGALLSIKLHPADLALLAQHPDRATLEQRHPGMQWEADAKAARGNCTLVTDRGNLDVGLFTQLQRLRELWAEGAVE